jgi:(4S)-4-hydroxy-5-phosphonooxypentane-2,3-dione isomerase
MIVTCVHVSVKPDRIDDFIQACKENHYQAIRESGNIRFDILQGIEDQTKFLLYEAYESEDCAAAHKKTAHYLHWREQVADWMAEPRKGVPFQMLFPLQTELK